MSVKNPVELGWHASNLFAYHIDDKAGEVTYFLDQKDPKFKVPYFNSGLNAPGGNYVKGRHDFHSPDELLRREIAEEFYAVHEEDEGLGFAFKGDPKKEGSKESHSGVNMERISRVVPMLLNGVRYVGSVVTQYNFPTLRLVEPAASTSLYAKELSADEYQVLSALVDEFRGGLSTDALKWGGANRFVPTKDFPTSKFAYDAGHKFLELFNRGLLPRPEGHLVLPAVVGARITQFIGPDVSLEEKLKTDLGTPTFEAFEGPLGFRFRVHSK